MNFGAVKKFALAAAILGLSHSAGLAQSSDAAAIAMMTGPDRQAKLEAGARKEGQFNFYTSLNIEPAVVRLKAAFEQKYPYIKFNFVRDQGNNLVQKILAEAQAGRPRADVAIGSTLEGLVKAKYLLPFVSPEMEAYDKQMYGEGNRWFIYRMSYYGVAYNTKLVKPEDAPKSIDDLLDPKWKGKMIWSTNSESGGPLLVAHILRTLGKDGATKFFDKLAQQNVGKQDTSVRALLDMTIAGEYPITLVAGLHHVAISQKDGAPIAIVPSNPVAARPDTIQLMLDVPHPHAAMLFIDFVLSREGQSLLNEVGYQAARKGIEPTPEFRHIIPELNGRTSELYSPLPSADDDWINKTFSKTSR